MKTPETTWPSPESACQRTVYAPVGSEASARDDRVAAALGVDAAREDAPAGVVHADAVREHLHALVEVDLDACSAPARAAGGSAGFEPRIDAWAERRGRRRQDREQRDEEGEPSHRCGFPASGERWPKIGAVSRSA